MADVGGLPGAEPPMEEEASDSPAQFPLSGTPFTDRLSANLSFPSRAYFNWNPPGRNVPFRLIQSLHARVNVKNI